MALGLEVCWFGYSEIQMEDIDLIERRKLMKGRLQIRNCKIWGLWRLSLTIIFLATLGIAMRGCVHHRSKTVVIEASEGVEVVYVEKAPPASKVEVIPKRPTPRAVWIPGYWKWKGNKYFWAPGHWEKKPRGTAWAPGQWKKTHRGWVWTAGYWH